MWKKKISHIQSKSREVLDEDPRPIPKLCHVDTKPMSEVEKSKVS